MTGISSETASILSWEGLAPFVDTVVENDLHGLHFQHVALCERRAWLHLHRIDYTHLDRRMEMGIVLHEVSRPRDHSVEGLSGLAPDRIDWRQHIVYEAKGGSGAEEAVSDQTAFYAVMLTAATGVEWRAATNLLQARRIRDVPITAVRLERMQRAARRLVALRMSDRSPPARRLPLCPACSYRHLCWA